MISSLSSDLLCAMQVLVSNPSNVKALYRRAQAHLGAQDFVEALVDIKAALQVRVLHPCISANMHSQRSYKHS